MGNCFGTVASKMKRRRKMCTIGVYGCDNAGKTTVIQSLCSQPITNVSTTVGFKKYELRRSPFRLVQLYDVGGGERIRDIWPSYFAEIFGLIFVIDASDIARLDETRRVLYDVLGNSCINGKPVLLLLNKQDHELAIDEVEAEERLALVHAVNRYRTPCRIETCQANRGTGSNCDRSVQTGFQWLLNRIDLELNDIEQRVEEDTKLEAERRAKKRMEILERVRRQREEDGENSDNETTNDAPVANGHAVPTDSSGRHLFKNKVLPFEPMPQITEEPSARGTSSIDSPSTKNVIPPSRLPPLQRVTAPSEHVPRASSSNDSDDDAEILQPVTSTTSQVHNAPPSMTSPPRPPSRTVNVSSNSTSGSESDASSKPPRRVRQPETITLTNQAANTLPPISPAMPQREMPVRLPPVKGGGEVKANGNLPRLPSTDECELPQAVAGTNNGQTVSEVAIPSLDVASDASSSIQQSRTVVVDSNETSARTKRQRKRRRLGRLLAAQQRNKITSADDQSDSTSTASCLETPMGGADIPLHCLPSSEPASHGSSNSATSSNSRLPTITTAEMHVIPEETRPNAITTL